MANVEFFGVELELHPEGPSEFAIYEFAEQSTADADSNEGMGAQLRLIDSGLKDEEEAAKFRRLARKHRAKTEDLMPLLKAVFEGQVDHPTGLASDSTDGPETIQPKSESTSDARVLQLAGGRLDRYAMVLEAQAHGVAV